MRQPPRPTLFPYTTLFRSVGEQRVNRRVGPKRERGSSDGLTRSQAERELRRLIESEISAPVTSRMTLQRAGDRKSTRLNSSHSSISYAVFCLKKKKQ